jgi:hypothetical protein
MIHFLEFLWAYFPINFYWNLVNNCWNSIFEWLSLYNQNALRVLQGAQSISKIFFSIFWWKSLKIWMFRKRHCYILMVTLVNYHNKNFKIILFIVIYVIACYLILYFSQRSLLDHLEFLQYLARWWSTFDNDWVVERH